MNQIKDLKRIRAMIKKEAAMEPTMSNKCIVYSNKLNSFGGLL